MTTETATVFLNGNTRAVLAFMCVSGLMIFMGYSMRYGDEKTREKITQTFVTICAIVITFYFASAGRNE